VPNIRLPAANTIESRDATSAKDALISNGFIEQESKEEILVYKRPGTIQKIVGTGVAQGIFVYGLYVYTFDAGKTPTTPTATLLSSL
jgi:hypothetical protein